MLYYPHNFIVISTMTMGIVMQDWAIDYHNAVPVSLKGVQLTQTGLIHTMLLPRTHMREGVK